MAKKKNAIAKRIAGVKIPKYIRKSSLLRALFGSPLGRDIMANALTAGAGAAAAILVRDRDQIAQAGVRGARKGAKLAGVATEAIQSAASAVVGVISDAAKSVLPEEPGKNGKTSIHGKDGRH